MFARAARRLLQGKSDEELMSLWVESRRDGRGNAAAFELLWERHSQATYQAVLRLLGSRRAQADEIFQDTWLEVTRAKSYRPGSFRAFVRAVATRKALDHLASLSVRRAAAAAPREAGDEDEGAEAAVPAPGGDPERGAQATEAASLVLEIAAQMPDVQRVAWTLRYVEQLTFEELADAMNTPVGTAKTRVRLANAFLAERLAERGIQDADLLIDRRREA